MLLSERIAKLRAQVNAKEVEVLAFTFGTREDELAVHHRLARSAARGREWYCPTPEVMAVVNSWRAQWGRDPIAA